jgi:hypothetical protein
MYNKIQSTGTISNVQETQILRRDGQLQPTEGPQYALRVHLRATCVYTYIERGLEGIQLTRR